MNPYLPVVAIIIVGIGLGGILSAMSHFIGPRRYNKIKAEAYECGVPMVHSGREKMSVKFYLTAILFILFDIETVFLYLWAKTFGDLGWFGFIEIMVFMVILVAGYVFVIKEGALEWI